MNSSQLFRMVGCNVTNAKDLNGTFLKKLDLSVNANIVPNKIEYVVKNNPDSLVAKLFGSLLLQR
jgi:hypothetical protein